jgi:hypothetical protein
MVMAEADPEFFLGRVEYDLNSENPELPKLFQDQSHASESHQTLHLPIADELNPSALTAAAGRRP